MLTDQAIKALQPPDKGYRIVWDGNLKGFGCRISQAGTRSFVVLVASGRPKTIGRYPLISLADARREAKLLLAHKTLGKIHPSRTAFAEAVQSFLEDAGTRTRPRTFKDYQRLLKRLDFGRTALADIKPRAILTHLMPLPPSTRHNVFAAGRAFFRWCLHQHLIDRSPMETIKVPAASKSRERVLTEAELQTLLRFTGASPRGFDTLVRLLILTGQRRGEIARLEWSWINETERTITIPSHVAKNGRTHCFPYGDLTADHFVQMDKMVGCPLLFPSRVGKPIAGWARLKERLDRETGIKGWTLHDLRRGYSSTMAALGVPQIVVEKLLNHATGSLSPIAAVYNRYSYLSEMRDAVLRYEAYLTTLTTPEG